MLNFIEARIYYYDMYIYYYIIYFHRVASIIIIWRKEMKKLNDVTKNK